MSGGMLLDRVEIQLRNVQHNTTLCVYVDVYDNSLSRKWLDALNNLLRNNFHLEKNYCFLGFADSKRNGEYILNRVNQSICAINAAEIGYKIDDSFDMSNCVTNDNVGSRVHGRNLVHQRMNDLHRYFEDLQGVSGNISPYYQKANSETRWHIRQLNLLCHEFESWCLSWRKQLEAPEWQRPSQLMCWLNAPRFTLDQEDYDLFGIETINRSLGGVYVGVNKAVGKHHWEVFNDEGRDSRVSELTTTTLKSQTEAAGDFDIEWANNPGNYHWQQKKLNQFREWLINNGFDPNDKTLTIGHPQVGQVDLHRSFGTDNFESIWSQLNTHLDVYSVKTREASGVYDYHWSDDSFDQRQLEKIIQGN